MFPSRFTTSKKKVPATILASFCLLACLFVCCLSLSTATLAYFFIVGSFFSFPFLTNLTWSTRLGCLPSLARSVNDLWMFYWFFHTSQPCCLIASSSRTKQKVVSLYVEQKSLFFPKSTKTGHACRQAGRQAEFLRLWVMTLIILIKTTTFSHSFIF